MSFAESVSREVVGLLGSVNDSDLVLSDTQRAQLARLRNTFRTVGIETGIPAALLAAVAWTESAFNQNAVNASSGATGLMQIMPFNFKAYGLTGNPTEPLQNIRAGAADLVAKGYGKKSFLSVVMGYNGFRSISDSAKLAAFTTYYRRIGARWLYLSTSGLV